MKKTIKKNKITKSKKKLEKTSKTSAKKKVVSNKKTKTVKANSKVVSKTKAKAETKSKPKTAAKTKVKASVKSKVKSKAKVKAKSVVSKTKSKVSPKPKKPVVKAKVKKEVKKVIAPKTRRSKGKNAMEVVDFEPYNSRKNEAYMSEEQSEHFRNVLLKWKEQLMSEVDRTMRNMQVKVSNYPDPVDRASQEEEFTLELRTRDRERKLLRKIEETLGRINDQDYGYCDDCGAEIGVGRLEARPTATQCIECKTIAEIREKQIGENG